MLSKLSLENLEKLGSRIMQLWEEGKDLVKQEAKLREHGRPAWNSILSRSYMKALLFVCHIHCAASQLPSLRPQKGPNRGTKHFLSLQEQAKAMDPETAKKADRMGQDFSQLAMHTTKTIVTEFKTPVEEKSIALANMGGTAGG